MWFGFNNSGKLGNGSGLRGLCTAMFGNKLFLWNGNDRRLQILEKNIKPIKNITAKSCISTYKACWLVFSCRLCSMQIKLKKQANHLRENEQLTHIEHKNPYEFFSSLDVSKGHWILWRWIAFLKIPVLPAAIRLFLPMITDIIAEPNAVLCVCQSCRSLALAQCFQSMDASLHVLACSLHSLLVFNRVGSFPVIFAKNGFEWIAQLPVASPNSVSEPNV